MLVEISSEIEQRLAKEGPNARKAFDARVKSLMTDVPDLPNFSRFHEAFRADAGARTHEGDLREAFYAAYDATGCEYIRLGDPEIDRRLKSGPDLVSANFVIPYPPGFPIMVPGQVITQETIDFMRKLGCEGDPRLRRERGPQAGASGGIDPTQPRQALGAEILDDRPARGLNETGAEPRRQVPLRSNRRPITT